MVEYEKSLSNRVPIASLPMSLSLSELMPVVRDLSHQDKVCLLQFLANALAKDEGVPEMVDGASFAIWSPYGAFEAAQTLQAALQTESTDE